MKKNFIYILMSFIFLAMSCQKAHDVEFYDLGSEFYISAASYTSLDNQMEISISNPLKNLSEIAISNTGGMTTNEDANGDLIPFTSDYAGTITLTDGEGSITLTDAQLGMTAIGWSANLQFDATFDGKPFARYKTITVKDPISFEDPGVTHRADTVYNVTYAVEPAVATVDAVTIQTKVSALGTYTDLAGSFGATGSVPLKGSDYAVGDTVFIKVTGTAGSKTATKVAKIVIAPNSLIKHDVNFTLDATAGKAYDLIKMRKVTISAAGDSADVAFVGAYTLTGLQIGFESNNNAEFVAGTSDDFDNADYVDIMNTNYGSAITSNADVSGGEVYFFRTRRGTGDYTYGILKVVNVDKPQGVLDDSSIEIEMKY